MAQTVGVVNGTDMRLRLGGNVVAYATVSSIDRSRNTTTRAHKDLVSGQTEVSLQDSESTINIEGFYNFDGANNTPAVLNTAFESKTLLVCEITNQNAGDEEYTFSAYVTALSSSFPTEEDATFTATLSVDGAITQQTIT